MFDHRHGQKDYSIIYYVQLCVPGTGLLDLYSRGWRHDVLGREVQYVVRFGLKLQVRFQSLPKMQVRFAEAGPYSSILSE